MSGYKSNDVKGISNWIRTNSAAYILGDVKYREGGEQTLSYTQIMEWSAKCDIAHGLSVLFIIKYGHANEEICDHKNESFEPVSSSVKFRQ
jgi:hypothetical protein